MQFTGAKGITVFVAIVLIVCGTGFGSGLLVGRHYPAHCYQKYGETRFMLDTATGKLCDPFKDPKADPFSKYAVDPNAPKDANGFQIVPKSSTDLSDIWKTPYPPACLR